MFQHAIHIYAHWKTWDYYVLSCQPYFIKFYSCQLYWLSHTHCIHSIFRAMYPLSLNRSMAYIWDERYYLQPLLKALIAFGKVVTNKRRWPSIRVIAYAKVVRQLNLSDVSFLTYMPSSHVPPALGQAQFVRYLSVHPSVCCKSCSFKTAWWIFQKLGSLQWSHACHLQSSISDFQVLLGVIALREFFSHQFLPNCWTEFDEDVPDDKQLWYLISHLW